MSDRKELAAVLAEMSRDLRQLGYRLRTKPVIGGTFGASGYVLASYTMIVGGLDAVQYAVMSDAGFVLGVADTKSRALAIARTVLRSFPPAELSTLIRAFAEEVDAERRQARMALRTMAELPAPRARVKSIPRRRREIFEAGGGACHYCATPLQLDGKWHIEHKMPKALLGSNERSNLVPSCVPCNLKKRDRTDHEFIAANSSA
jgi:hypothetical protein